MALAYQLQRLLTRVGVAIALCWGVAAGEPIRGLWSAVWIIALACGGLGALLHEYDTNRPDRLCPVHPGGRPVMLSGFGYLLVAIGASVFPTGVTAALLVAVIADFWAGHYVFGTQQRQPAPVGL